MSPASAAAPPGEIEADDADAEHRQRLDATLQHAIEQGATRWDALLAAAGGADPRLVARRVRARGLTVQGLEPAAEPTTEPATELAPALDPDPAPSWIPELHARDFEWYFTPACARDLAARAAAAGTRVLCMGTPTVAFALLDQPSGQRLTLVDRNPLVERRHPRAGSLELLHEDLAAVRPQAGLYDVAVFDAPWYPATLHRWLAVAARAVRPGGRVLFALLPALHRPGAGADRVSLLAAARRLGPTRVEPGALRYHSPRFEHEALAAAGLPVPPVWRTADLVELHVERPARQVPAPVQPEPAWARFVVGPQVVHLDLRAPAEPGEVLTPVDDRPDFRYTSISTRDPRRARIGLWTSRSRVARVRRPALVAELLEHLAQIDERAGERIDDLAGGLRVLARAPALRGLDPPARQRLLGALRTLLDMP